jgi:hypothetical protein
VNFVSVTFLEFFVIVFIASTLLDYFTGAGIHATEVPKARKFWLTVSLAGNLGLLAYFKYVNFFIDSFVALANSAGWHVSPFTLQIILPIGISFYSFHAISYALDIYSRKRQPTRSLLQNAPPRSTEDHCSGPLYNRPRISCDWQNPRRYRPDCDTSEQLHRPLHRVPIPRERLHYVVHEREDR